jgi:DNA gyrase subunit A
MGSDRKTEIVKTVVDIDNEDLIKNEQLIVTLTGEGYVKSAPVDTYRVQKRGGKGVIGGKESDDVFDMFEAGSKDVVLFFTNRGLMYRRKAYEIPQGSRTAKGMHVSNLLSLSEGEFVTNMIALKSFEQKGYLVFATQKGLIKRSDISEYDTNRINTGLTAIKIEDGDEVAFVMVTDGKRDVFILTANGYAVRYHEDLVRSTGRQSYGVTALKLEDGDSIAQVLSLDPDDAPDIVIMTATGQAKRTKSDEYRALSGRNVRGYAAMNREAARKYGGVVGAAAVGRDESLLVLTEQGKVVRINAKDIRETGRATGGVRGVRLNDGDSVSRVARLSKIAEEMESEEEAAV